MQGRWKYLEISGGQEYRYTEALPTNITKNGYPPPCVAGYSSSPMQPAEMVISAFSFLFIPLEVVIKFILIS